MKKDELLSSSEQQLTIHVSLLIFDPLEPPLLIIAQPTGKHSQNDVFKICKMLLDLVLHLDESISIYGVSALFDMNRVQLGHALQLNPPLIKRSVSTWEQYTCRPKRLEFVNSPMHVNVVLNIFRSFMSSKMKQRLSINKGNPVNHSIPLNVLPKDLGGTGPGYAELTAHWERRAVEHRDWFLEMERYKTQTVKGSSKSS